jgi:hypothetical protein
LALAAAPKESDGQHAECECAAGEHHRLPPRKPLDLAEELICVALAHVAAETLDLLGAPVDILGEHRLCAFLAEMLAGLAKRLRYAGHRPGEVLLPHVEPRRHLLRDLLGGLILHRAGLPASLAALSAAGILAHAGDAAGGLLNLVDYLATQAVGLDSRRRRGLTRLAS